MDLRRFTEAAQALLAQSHGVASAGGAEAVEPEHMLLALATQPGATASLESQAIDPDSLISTLTPSAKDGRSNSLLLPSLKLKSLIGAVWEKAKDGPQHQIGIADIIPILLQEDGLLAKKIASTIKPKNVEKALIEVTTNVQPNEDSGKYRNLRNYTRCLTDLARHGLLDPVVGRHREVRRLMQVLCRRSKNNPVLVGPPGVGKSSIVEALAQRMADGDVPEMLLGKELFYLDLPALYSGSDYRGLLEERTKGVMADIRACHGNAILLINDLPSVFRATSAQDLGGLLKSALGAGALRCIGVAGLDDYRNSIEKDASLERNFQSILVDELSVDETISVLRGAKGKYEAYHDILLTDGALIAAANLSRRFITDRSLPDKAIDLLDEASSKVRIEWDNMPVAVDSTDRLVSEMEAELGQLPPGQRSRDLKGRSANERLEELRAKVQKESANWQTQGQLAQDIRKKRHHLSWHELIISCPGLSELSKDATEEARAEGQRIKASLSAAEAKLATLQKDGRLFKLDIVEEDIAEIVATTTGIPLNKLLEDERAKLLDMETALHRRIVGQDDAVHAVSNAVRLARVGMKDPTRPVGSFLFLGPTGVGKTELARALAEFLFDDDSAMIRIDMSEYLDKHTVSRLTGAPPGYIGYDDSGQLTETVRRKPYSVVLFDETEKAHPDVFNILLQIMDDGRLTDGHGRTVDFKNTIITMTSNIGGHLYRDNADKAPSELRALLDTELRAHFRPEFLNRVDAIVYFELLRADQIEEIVDIQVGLVNRRLAGGGISLAIDEKAKAYLAREGFDLLQGARPLKRLIQHAVLEPLALRVLDGTFSEGDTILVRLGGRKMDVLQFSKARAS